MKALAAVFAAFSIICLRSEERSELQVNSTRAFENESSLTFTVTRAGPSNFVQTVEFATGGGTALATAQYVPTNGVLTFLAGQVSARVTVRLIDNASPDGERYFYLRLSNPQPCADILPDGPVCGAPPGGPPRFLGCDDREGGFIIDDEFPLTRVDPSFVPGDVVNDLGAPDVRLGGDMPGTFGGVAVLPGGRILAYFSPPFQYRWQLVRLLPSGELDPDFKAQPVDARFHALLSDGKLLIGERNSDGTEETLKRINLNGEVDETFTAYHLKGGAATVLPQSNGKVLVHAYFNQYDKPVPGGGYYAIGGVRRLNLDGSADSSFAPSLGEIGELFLRKNGRIIVKARDPGRDWNIYQLFEDGTKDPAFAPALEAGLTAITGWVEQPDGRLLISVGQKIRRLNSDGTLDSTFAPVIPDLCTEGGVPNADISLMENGYVLFRGFFDSVDGFPRHGLVRLRNAEPVPEIMVLTPAEAYRSGTARIRVIRTGNTDAAAEVDFSTDDGTAVHGRDYRALDGTLHFAAMEASKVVEIPLLTNSVSPSERLWFNLLLKNPSARYRAIGATTVALLPELRLLAGSFLTNRTVRAEGASPQIDYALETSSDLQDWRSPGGYSTSRDGSTITFSDINFFPGPNNHFFRIRRY